MPRLAKNEFPSDIHFIDSDQLCCRWLVFWKVLCRTLVLELYTGYWTRSKEVLLDVELISLPSSQNAGLPCRESLAQGCLFCSLVSHLAANAIQSRQKSRITGQRLSFLFSGFTSGCRCDPVAPKVKNHRPTAVFSVLWFHIWLQMRSSRAKSAFAARCETREQKRQPWASDSLQGSPAFCDDGNEISSTSSNTSLLRVQYPVYNSNTRVLQSTFQKTNQRQQSWSESIKWMSLGNSFLANRGMLANNMKG